MRLHMTLDELIFIETTREFLGWTSQNFTDFSPVARMWMPMKGEFSGAARKLLPELQ